MKNKIQQIFNKTKVILPVIHIKNGNLALKNAIIAKEAGADGIWIIDHNLKSNSDLSILANYIENECKFWVGANYLGLGSNTAFEEAFKMDVRGVWTDNAGIEDDFVSEEADIVNELRLLAKDSCLYFGGVAFKYQKPIYDLATVTKVAKGYVDVITTSGSGTGIAADIDKIKTIYEAAEGHPIAIASGITPENVEEYLPYVDAFLVSTGINKDFYNFDEERLKMLVDKINNYEERS